VNAASRKAWENTAHYLSAGESPEVFFLAEECRDAEEAETLAQHYRSIIQKLTQQMEAQR
jgi:hypothetical protein